VSGEGIPRRISKALLRFLQLSVCGTESSSQRHNFQHCLAPSWKRHPALGAKVKRVFLFLLSCAAIFPCSVMTGLGQQSLNSGAPARPIALTGGLKGNGPFAVDYSFKGTNGSAPTATPIQDATGNLYGTTSSGGPAGLGVVFKLDTSNHEKVLHAFSGPDGATPFGALVMDGSGNLYGTTSAGGGSNACQGGCGTVFKIDTTGTETVLHSFSGNPDGANPYAGLVMDGSGNLYGTTEYGGSGSGTVFKIDPAGNESVLYSFGGSPNDGAGPMAALTLDPSGNLYGTTFTGGTAGFGTVFEVDTTNTETVLYNFTGLADGANPFGGVTRDDVSGTLYGTAENGGRSKSGLYRIAPDIPHGCCRGVLYALNGGGLQVLYTFTGGNDGGNPASSLVLSNGFLYGTTLIGGPGHRGTAFSVTVATGSESVLHGFSGGKDGGTPGAGLLLNSAGVLYGTTQNGGGRNKFGTVFQYKTK
jgi:uncharacterized repeat protein (TIGR03803 family)